LRIKLATGVSDIPLFVEKFLTHEKHYRDMLSSVKLKEVDFVKYQTQISKMQNTIDKFNSNIPGKVSDSSSKKKLDKIHKSIRELLEKKSVIVQAHNKLSSFLRGLHPPDLAFASQ
jgi:hypothetical protein